jgi:signal transduction histidine kinase
MRILLSGNVIKSICISNDCTPLSNDMMEHIFDRFYTGRDGNTGIGMSLAKEIIEQHGWKSRAAAITDGIKFIVDIE